MTRFSRLNRLAAPALAVSTLLAVAPAAQHASPPSAHGPLTLVMSYDCSPGNRLSFLRDLRRWTLPQLEQWHAQGTLASYQLFESRYVDSSAWDASMIVTFPDEAAAARWTQIERATPAGLQPATLALTSAIDTTPADIVRQHEPEKAPAHPIFMVLPYDLFVPTPEYLSYADAYVLPQLEGWMSEGVLAGYELIVARYAPGRPWGAWLVLEYRSDTALGQREAVVARVRARLQQQPEWRAIAANKQKIREEKEAVIADTINLERTQAP